MAYTAPRTWVAAETVTAAIMNTHIKDNIDFLYKRIQTGTVSITPSAANTPTSVTVTFPVAFASAPYVVISAATGVPGTTVTGVGADTETTTNFRATLTRTNTTITLLRWIAMMP